jgi:predicted ester cyclase
MTIEENKSIVRRFLEGVFRSPDTLEDICTHDIVAHWRDETLFSSLGQLKDEFVIGHNNSFPDFIFEIEDIIAEKNMVAARLVQTGTHEGIWADAAPTGKRFRVREVMFFRLRNQKIAEMWVQVDLDDKKEQLGFRWLPPEA